MKKLILTLAFAIMFSMPVFADSGISVMIEGTQIVFDVPPQIINDRTMVPMRKIFETLGAKVDWYGEANLIIATKNELIIAMEIGKADFSVTNVITGETKTVELDSVPVIIDERTLVPARAISESLGYYVDWSAQTQTVLITSQAPTV